MSESTSKGTIVSIYLQEPQRELLDAMVASASRKAGAKVSRSAVFSSCLIAEARRLLNHEPGEGDLSRSYRKARMVTSEMIDPTETSNEG